MFPFNPSIYHACGRTVADVLSVNWGDIDPILRAGDGALDIRRKHRGSAPSSDVLAHRHSFVQMANQFRAKRVLVNAPHQSMQLWQQELLVIALTDEILSSRHNELDAGSYICFGVRDVTRPVTVNAPMAEPAAQQKMQGRARVHALAWHRMEDKSVQLQRDVREVHRPGPTNHSLCGDVPTAGFARTSAQQDIAD